MNRYEIQYRILLNNIIYNGVKEDTRAGKARVNFGMSLATDLREGFPIITGKKIFYEKALAEFRWMWLGYTDLEYLQEHGITWWDKFADGKGDLGHTYGYQIRNFNGKFDQVEHVAREIINESRRAVLTFWNPEDASTEYLPPCYTSMVFVRIGDELHMDFNIRSSDTAVGLPYDICIGALFLHEMAALTKLKPCLMKVNLSNAHIYENNILSVEEYLATKMYDLPIFKYDRLLGYESGKLIKMKLNV